VYVNTTSIRLGTNGKVRVELDWLNSSYIGKTNVATITTNKSWTLYTFNNIQPLAGTNKTNIVLELMNAAGTVLFDDVLLTDTSSSPTPTPEPTPTPTPDPTPTPTPDPTPTPTPDPTPTILTQYSVHKEVQGFYSLYANQSDWQNIRFDLLSTLILNFIHPTSDGNININDSDVPSDLVNLAHKNGVKVVISIQTEDKSITDTILTTSKDDFLDNIIHFIQKNNLDGVDIDIEKIGEINSITGGQNRLLMTSFIKDLEVKVRMSDPNYRISINVGGDYHDVDKVFDLTSIQNSVDYIMVMGYDYHWLDGPTAGSVAPMNSYDNGSSIRDSMKYYSKLVDKKKLLLGVPYYGIEWNTKNGEIESPTTSRGVYYSYLEIKDKIDQHGRIWDDTWKTPWYKYQYEGEWYQGHYDDVQSLGIKYDLVNSFNFAGIGIWKLEYSSNESELWQLIQDKFGK